MASSSFLLAREAEMVVYTYLHFTGREENLDMTSLASPLEGRIEATSGFISLGGGATHTSIFHSCANDVKVEVPNPSPL